MHGMNRPELHDIIEVPESMQRSQEQQTYMLLAMLQRCDRNKGSLICC